MKKNSLKTMILLTMIGCISFSFLSYAENQKSSPLFTDIVDSEIDFYVPSPGDDYEVECQIGTEACNQISVAPIAEEDVPVHTIFLIDNSLSVTEKYRPMISEILTQQAANRMNGELYSVAVFSSGIDYVLKDSSNYMDVKNAIDSITYQDQETYLTDVLYELLQQMEQSEEHAFRRIVIASDGVDNKAIGYTKEELYALLEKTSCPIYTLGCTYKDNNEELKNMFALSRMTGGMSWLLDDVSDIAEVTAGISTFNDAVKVRMTPNTSLCDGTTKGISLSFRHGEDTIQYMEQIQMPFGKAVIQDEASTEMEVETELIETEAKSEMEVAGTEEKLNPVVQTKKGENGLLIVGVVVLMVCVGGVFLLLRRRKTVKTVFQEAPESKYFSSDGSERKDHKTAYIGTDNVEEKVQTRNTCLAWGKQVELEDQRDPKRHYSAGLMGVDVLVGYNNDCQICLNYEESVSGKHCRIFEENGQVKIVNLSRTNPTEVNGQKIGGSVVLKTGDVLTIGRLHMKVRING